MNTDAREVNVAPWKVAGILLAAIAMIGCQSLEPAFSDLTSRDRDYETTRANFERSLAKELSPETTMADGRAWFKRHHIPLDEDLQRTDRELHGGFYPLGSQGYWASWDIGVTLTFDASGKYQSHEIRYGQSNL